jgi:hypothetical protein
MAPAAENGLIEAISEATLADVHRLVRQILPKLHRILTTQELVSEFTLQVVHQLSNHKQHGA